MAIVTTNLEVWYDSTNPASNTGAGTTLYDLSGNGRNGTINNPTRVSNYFEMSKGTTNKSIDIGTNFSSFMSGASCQFSIEMWMWVDSAAGSNSNRYSVYAGNSLATGGFIIAGERPSASGGVQTNIGMYFSTPYYQWNPGNLSSGSWIQYTFVNDGADRRIYQNGVLAFSTTLGSSSIAAGDINFQFGGSIEGYYVWNGRFAIGRVYSSALTVGQILQNYNTDVVSFNPPVVYLNANESASAVAPYTTWFDLENSFDFTMYSPSFTTKVVGVSPAYYSFPSRNSGDALTVYGQYNSAPAVTNPSVFTGYFWVRRNANHGSFNQNRVSIFANGREDNISLYNGWSYGANNNPSAANDNIVLEASTIGISDSGVPFNDAEWVNIAYVYTGGVISFYLNGVLVDTNSFSTPVTPTSGMWISRTAGSLFSWMGDISIIRQYNYALIASQIQDLYDYDLAEYFTPSPSPYVGLVGGRTFGQGFAG